MDDASNPTKKSRGKALTSPVDLGDFRTSTALNMAILSFVAGRLIHRKSRSRSPQVNGEMDEDLASEAASDGELRPLGGAGGGGRDRGGDGPGRRHR